MRDGGYGRSRPRKEQATKGEVVTEEGFGLADVVVDFGKSVMGSFPYPSKARQCFHLCSA